MVTDNMTSVVVCNFSTAQEFLERSVPQLQIRRSKWIIMFHLKITHKPLYNTVHYNMVLDITGFKDGPQKMYRLYRKMTINGHFSI